ncbi:MAG: tyrosine-type recombinase/integrase [Nitrospirales bacterium]
MATVSKRKWQSGDTEKTAWVVRYTDQDGKPHLKTFKTKKEADAFNVEAQHQVSQGTHTADSASVTVAAAAEEWIKGRELDGVERSTQDQYRQHIDLHIVPIIGNVKLSRLTAPMVNTFKETLLETRSRAMAAKALQSFRSLIADAQRRGLVAQNVARGVIIKARNRDKEEVVAGVHFPTKDEARTMVEKVSDRWRPLIVTAILTGMRSSELRGLTWGDVDFDKREIRVRQRADKYNALGSPKSKTSRRTIPMTPMVFNTLREWQLACPKGEANLVFPTGRGNVESNANIYNRGMVPLERKCGFIGAKATKPKYGLHALRHFYASLIIDQGFSPKKCQTLLGHSSIQMTFDTYGHLFPDPKEDRAKLEAAERALVG